MNIILRLQRVGLWVLRIMAMPLICCVAATSAQADLLWGANGHPYTAYPGVTFEQQMSLLADLGLKSYRVNVVDIRDLGPLIAAGKKHGVAVFPVLTPGLNMDRETPEALYTKSYNIAFTLVSRHKADIRVWELGNELENYAILQPCEMRDDGTQYNCAWGPAGGVGGGDYFGPRWAKVSAILKGLSEGAIAADPTVRKAMGTAGWGHIGAFERMKQDGIKWDISVWHLYSEDPEWAFKELVKYGKPIWITEFNHSGGSQNGAAAAQSEGVARWIKRFRELAPLYRIEGAHIYELLDETYWAPNVEAYYGLIELVKVEGKWQLGSPKPVYDTVKTLIRGAGAVDAASPPSNTAPPAESAGK